jgi:hypothetical protein
MYYSSDSAAESLIWPWKDKECGRFMVSYLTLTLFSSRSAKTRCCDLLPIHQNDLDQIIHVLATCIVWPWPDCASTLSPDSHLAVTNVLLSKFVILLFDDLASCLPWHTPTDNRTAWMTQTFSVVVKYNFLDESNFNVSCRQLPPVWIPMTSNCLRPSILGDPDLKMCCQLLLFCVTLTLRCVVVKYISSGWRWP